MRTLVEPMPCGFIIVTHCGAPVKRIFSDDRVILHGGGLGGVFHKHGTGHGANAAGHRGDERGLLGLSLIHI